MPEVLDFHCPFSKGQGWDSSPAAGALTSLKRLKIMRTEKPLICLSVSDDYVGRALLEMVAHLEICEFNPMHLTLLCAISEPMARY